MRAVSLRAVGSAALVLWLSLIVASYYVVHKPFGPENVVALLSRAADIVSAGAIALLATAVGRRILARVHIPDRLELLLFSAGLGLGIASLIMLALAWIGLPGRAIGLALAAVAGVALRRDLRDLVRSLAGLRPTFPSGFPGFLAGFVLAAMGFAFVLALLPPTAWDALSYHLVGPSRLLEGAGYSEILQIPHLGYSSLLEHLFLAGMWIRGDGVAALLHWSYAALTLMALWRLGSHLDRTHRWLALALLLSAPSWVLLAGWPYADWGLTFYTTAGFLALTRWSESQDQRWLLLAGAMAGLALAVKYTAVYAVLALAAVLLLEARRHGWREALRAGATLGLAAAPFILPFLLRNWAFTGNPVYPFLLGGGELDPLREWRLTRPGTGLLGEPLRLLLSPAEATLLGVEGKEGYEATIGPLSLTLLPLAVWAAARRDASAIARQAGIAVAVLYGLWLLGLASSFFFRSTRLLLPLFPLLALLGAAGMERSQAWGRPSFSAHRFLKAVVAAVLALELIGFAVLLARENPWAYLAGSESREAYLARTLGTHFESMTYLNDELPRPARIQFFWEPRSYHCQVDCVPDTTLDAFSDLAYRHGGGQSIAVALREQGVSHLLVYEQGLRHQAANDPAAFPAEDRARLEAFLADQVRPVRRFGEAYTLYAVR